MSSDPAAGQQTQAGPATKSNYIRPGSAGTFGRRSVVIEIIEDDETRSSSVSPTTSPTSRSPRSPLSIPSSPTDTVLPSNMNTPSSRQYPAHTIITQYLQQQRQIRASQTVTSPQQSTAQLHLARRKSLNSRRKSRHSTNTRTSRLSSGSSVLWRSPTHSYSKRNTHESRASSLSATASARSSQAPSSRSSAPLPLKAEILVGEHAGQEVGVGGEEWESWEDVKGGEVSVQDLMAFINFAETEGEENAWGRFGEEFVASYGSDSRQTSVEADTGASPVGDDERGTERRVSFGNPTAIVPEEKRLSRMDLEMWFEIAKHELFGGGGDLTLSTPLPTPPRDGSFMDDTAAPAPTPLPALPDHTPSFPPTPQTFSIPARSTSRECLRDSSPPASTPPALAPIPPIYPSLNKKKNREVRVVGLGEDFAFKPTAEEQEGEGREVFMVFPGSSSDGGGEAGDVSGPAGERNRTVKGVVSIERLRGGPVWEKRKSVMVGMGGGLEVVRDEEEEDEGSDHEVVVTHEETVSEQDVTITEDTRMHSKDTTPTSSQIRPSPPPSSHNRQSRASSASASFRNRYSLAPSLASSERFHPPSMSGLDADEINFLLNERWSVSTFASATWAQGVRDMTEEEFLRIMVTAKKGDSGGSGGGAEADGGEGASLEVRYDQLVARLRLAGIEVPVTARPVAVASEAGGEGVNQGSGSAGRQYQAGSQATSRNRIGGSTATGHSVPTQERHGMASQGARPAARGTGLVGTGGLLGRKKEKMEKPGKGKDKARQKDYEEVARRLKMAGLMDVAGPAPREKEKKERSGTSASATMGSTSGPSTPASESIPPSPSMTPASSATSGTLVNAPFNLMTGSGTGSKYSTPSNSTATTQNSPKSTKVAPPSLASMVIPNRERVLSRLRKGSHTMDSSPLVASSSELVDGGPVGSSQPQQGTYATPPPPPPQPTKTLKLPPIRPPSSEQQVEVVYTHAYGANAGARRVKRRSGGNGLMMMKRRSGEEEVRRYKRMSRIMTGVQVVPPDDVVGVEKVLEDDDEEKAANPDLEWEDIEITFVDKLVEGDTRRVGKKGSVDTVRSGVGSMKSGGGGSGKSVGAVSGMVMPPTPVPSSPRAGSPNGSVPNVSVTPMPTRPVSPEAYGTNGFGSGSGRVPTPPLTPPQMKRGVEGVSVVGSGKKMMTPTEAMGMRPVAVPSGLDGGSVVSIGTMLRSGPPTQVV
ncbi:hypothetical protein HDV00_002018 [Rhizophlyctis rosea]|nr:hypothetical protein HDV00_002018 [Rhizophlyctis rosea]